jgi:hypothetical protein
MGGEKEVHRPTGLGVLETIWVLVGFDHGWSGFKSCKCVKIGIAERAHYPAAHEILKQG